MELRQWKFTFILATIVSSLLVLETRAQCPLPTEQQINALLGNYFSSLSSEGTTITASTINYHFTCLAVDALDMYRSTSIAVNYTRSDRGSQTFMSQIQLQCVSGSYDFSPDGGFESSIPASVFGIPTRRDCRRCFSDSSLTGSDAQANCLPCSANCQNIGQGACDNGGTECCGSFFNSECVQTCPALYHSNATHPVCECSFSTCSNGGEFVPPCSCNCNGTSYTGDTCTVDIDECLMNPCERGGTCTNFDGGYSCECIPGYTGQNCEVDINDCEPHPCNNGRCMDRINNFTCTCDIGFTGEFCEINIDDCRPGLCHNGGTCIDAVNDYRCLCPNNYGGRSCDDDVDECSQRTSPCVRGSCENEVGTFHCECPPRWTGQICDQCNIANCESCTVDAEDGGALCTKCAKDYRVPDPNADAEQLGDNLKAGPAQPICVRNCTDSRCITCPDLNICESCQRFYKVENSKCEFGSPLGVAVILSVVVSLFVVIVLVVLVIALVAGVYLYRYNKKIGIGYRAARKDPGDIKKELVLTKISEL